MRLIKEVESPNHSSRGGLLPSVVVLHYTQAGIASRSVRWLCDRASQASAHFVVGRAGEVWQLVPLDRAAWHAGQSRWFYKGSPRIGVNRFSIGIEFANCGPMVRSADGSFWYEQGRSEQRYRGSGIPERREYMATDAYWEPYTPAQIDAGVDLLAHIRAECAARWAQEIEVVGHDTIAVPFGRKMDPGPLFPWERFGGETCEPETA